MPYKLLLADDSLTIQKVVELVLANENFDIKTVNDGEAALQVMESFVPDIVLADIDMPKLNGYQFCQNIKNNAAFAHIPVILLAGAFEPFDEDQAKAVSADDFIIKPFESQELISKVKGLLASVQKPVAPVLEEERESIEEPEPETPALDDISMMMEAASAPATAAEDEISWDDAFQEASGEKTEEETQPEEIPVTDAEPFGFGDELSLAMSDEEVLPAAEKASEALDLSLPDEMPAVREETVETFDMPSEAGLSDTVGQALDTSALVSTISDEVRLSVSDIAPAVIERVTRELVRELLGPLRAEVEATIRKVVPEVAEAIIKKEIEKITSGI